MLLGYHGTSLEGAQGILKEGYKTTAPKLWTISTGNMHVFEENNSRFAVVQALNAAVVSSSMKRALVIVDITHKDKQIDRRCYPEQHCAFELKEPITSDDVVAVYADIKPINPIFKVLQKVSICKQDTRPLFKSDLIQLNEEEQELFNIIQTFKVEPRYKSKMELIFKHERYEGFEQYIEEGF